MKKYTDIGITEKELKELTSDMVDAHNESLPKMREASLEVVENLTKEESAFRHAGFSRRKFLVGLSAASSAALLAACSSNSSSSSTTSKSGSSSSMGSNVPIDIQVAGLAASLEVLAVNTYQAGISAATAGKLGTVPPAVVTFAQTAKSQHNDHATSWNNILTSSGYMAVNTPDPVVQKTVNTALMSVTDVVSLAKLALELENVAAATYLNGLSVVQTDQGKKVAATIQPVEMQHAAILNFVLGQYPVPNAFASTQGARPVSDYTVQK